MKKKYLAIAILLVVTILLFVVNYLVTYNTYHFSRELIYAISQGDEEKVENILNDYPNGDVNTKKYKLNLIPLVSESVNEYPIQAACIEGNIHIVKMLVDRGAKVNVIAGHDATEMPLVFYSVGLGYGSAQSVDNNHLEITEYLISQGLNTKELTKQGVSVCKTLLVYRDRKWLTQEDISVVDNMIELVGE